MEEKFNEFWDKLQKPKIAPQENPNQSPIYVPPPKRNTFFDTPVRWVVANTIARSKPR